MHTRERSSQVWKAAVGIGRFLRRRKRWGIALLVTAPLALTGSIELFALNLLGLGIGFLFIRSRVRKRRQDRDHRLWLERRERESAQDPG